MLFFKMLLFIVRRASPAQCPPLAWPAPLEASFLSLLLPSFKRRAHPQPKNNHSLQPLPFLVDFLRSLHWPYLLNQSEDQSTVAIRHASLRQHLFRGLFVSTFVSNVVSDGEGYCTSTSPGDYGSDKWYGQSKMDKTTVVTPSCYNATMKNDYAGHDYIFKAAVCNRNLIYIDIDTPHGRKDRRFKVNFNKADGTQYISMDTGGFNLGHCTAGYVIGAGQPDLGLIDHITVQEQNRKSEDNGQKCLWDTFCVPHFSISF